MKIQIHITTYKRPEWCFNLLKQIKEQSNGYDINVAVFHDKCDSDYSNCIQLCKDNAWQFLTTKVNFGKWNFWKLNNLMYQHLDSVDYDYYLQLPDDVLLVDNFFNRIIEMLPNNKSCINPLTLNLHSKRLYGQDIKLTGWADCCFFTSKEMMQGIRLSQPKNSITRNTSAGSGTGNSFSGAFKNRNGQIYQIAYALVYHLGYDGKTVMHKSDRWAVSFENKYKSKLHEKDKAYIMSKTMNNIESIIKGKNIAFVGLAPNIKGKGLGAEIDSADVVYRTNYYPLSSELENDYGKRCDILAIQEAYKKHIKQYEQSGIKCIVHYANNLETTLIKVLATDKYRKQIGDFINTLTVEQMKYPTAGLVAYFLCKQYGCKSFKFYGITGYQNLNGEVQNHEGENNYVGDYLDFWDERKQRLIKTDMVNNKYHNFKAHNEFIRYGLSKNYFQLDEYSLPYFK